MNLKYFRPMKKALFLVLLYFVCQFVATLPFILWHLVQGTSGSMSLTDPMELSLSVLLSNVLMIAHLLFWKDVRFGMHSFVEVPFRMLLVCVPLVLSAMFVLNAFNEWLDLPNWGEAAFLGMSRNVWGVLAITIGAPLVEELLFRGALQGLMRPCGSAAAVFGPALLFALLHMNLSQGITAFLCGIFLGWLTERTGSVLPGMMLHLINNCIAFADIYLQMYAPNNIAMGIELFVLLFFPLAAAWLLWRAVTRQGFSFGAGMHPGVDALSVFTSPAYTLAILFLAVASVYFSITAG